MFDCPYKGLAPYSEKDGPLFFGREAERKIIIASLIAHRLTLLYGACGVGMTSLLRAGVAERLRLIARDNLKGEGTPNQAIVVFHSWGDDPLPALVYSVQSSLGTMADGQPSEWTSPRCALIKSLHKCTERLNGELLIILDQFEEYFLYHAEEEGDSTFGTEFPRAVNDPDLPVHFLISIREDSLAKLDRFKATLPNLFDNSLRIEHLDLESGRAVIKKSVQQHNHMLPPDEMPFEIEQALIDQVLAGAALERVNPGHPAKPRVEVSQVQLVMSRLWDEEIRAGSRVLRMETLQRLGGPASIMQTYLDRVIEGLLPDQRELAAQVFRFIVTPSGAKIALTCGDLAAYTEVREAELESPLKKLLEQWYKHIA